MILEESISSHIYMFLKVITDPFFQQLVFCF